MVMSCISEGNHDTRENIYFAGQWQTLLQHNLVSYSHCHERGLDTLTIRLHFRDYQTVLEGGGGGVLDRYKKRSYQLNLRSWNRGAKPG